MVGWHHRLNGHGFGCTPGVGDGQGGLTCRSPWGRKESPTTEQLNGTKRTSLMAQQVKNLPATQETQGVQVRSLGGENPLEEKNGNPLQYSCLENPMDRGTWQATVQGLTKSRTQLTD